MVGEERGVTMTEKKKFQVPHSMAIIVAAMILASILTYLIPGGNFERVVNDAGKTVVVPGSFTYVEQTPVNPLTILDYVFSRMGYRLFCMIPFLVVSIVYIVLYGRKVKADPTKSYIYGNKVDFGDFDPENVPTFEKRHIPVAIVVVISLLYMIYVAIFSDLSFHTSATIFLYMGLLAGIAYRMPVNEMCKQFCNGVKGMASTGILIGFAYAISGILSAGNVMDTVVNALANGLAYVPPIMQAPAMFIMHIIVNLFVTSGSGQAAVTMPIFIPVADLVGMSRQTAVLAFNFGDGFCNFILPHAAATMGFVGCANIPFTKWFRFVIKLFAIWVVVGCALLMAATLIHY